MSPTVRIALIAALALTLAHALAGEAEARKRCNAACGCVDPAPQEGQ